MDLVERYLAAIARELPKAKAADITAELRDLIMSQVEEKEAELGRPLSTKELEAVLKAQGHPLVVAARYRRRQHLIGPDAYPFYGFTVKMVVGLVLAVNVVAGAIRIATAVRPVQALMQTLENMAFGVLVAFALVTVGFILGEGAGMGRRLARWRPSRLPPAHLPFRPKSRFDLAFEGAAAMVFLAWWVGWMQFADAPGGRDDIFMGLRPTEAWADFYWPVLALMLGSLAVTAAKLAWPARIRETGAATILVKLYACLLAFALLRAGPWVTLHGEAERAIYFSGQLNQVIGIVLIVIGVVSAIEAGVEAWRLWRGARPRLNGGLAA